MNQFGQSLLLIFVLLNPFIMSIYLLTLVKNTSLGTFSSLIIRAGLISFVVFVIFAWLGEVIFDEVLQIRFPAFMIFGGITFLIIGVRLILGIGPAMESINPQSKEVAGAIAIHRRPWHHQCQCYCRHPVGNHARRTGHRSGPCLCTGVYGAV